MVGVPNVAVAVPSAQQLYGPPTNLLARLPSNSFSNIHLNKPTN